MNGLAELKPRWSLLRQTQMWPPAIRLDPERWLSNFQPAELEHAKCLLDSFFFLSSDATRRLFVHAVRKLSQQLVSTKTSLTHARQQWNNFLNQAIVVRVTDERPSDADSGFIFARLARDFLGIEERRILAPENAIIALLGTNPPPVVFVDDFVGSGNQFIELWRRKYEVGTGRTESFESVASSDSALSFAYTPIICAWAGSAAIAKECPRVCISPAHYLDDRYSVFHPSSVLWRDGFHATASVFVESVSKRAGIPGKNLNVGDWRGFCGLGLAVAFDHGIPDSTLPLFSWAQNGWKPLISKE